ncbi:arginine--tRNA ligase [candidate division KSB1 bacterium 4484_188]|nr:MAG: arginine--tRNA ligase [candidate division KSB1 bacterium 4484_188]
MEAFLKQTIETTLKDLSFPNIDIIFETPKLDTHGDLSTNVAMQLARPLKQNPRSIAEQIIAKLKPDPAYISKIEIAGPGFINFFYSNNYLQQSVEHIIKAGEQFGRNNFGKGKKAQVEFVSANPTGPLTIGHGRQAVLGDTIANFLEWCGFQVTREYYFNNAGRQMRVLGESVRLRYLELLGELVEFPDDHYQGEYIKDIARQLHRKYGDSLKAEQESDLFKSTAEQMIFQDIKNTLQRLGIVFDVFFNEKDLYEQGDIDRVIRFFKENNLAYQKDGALWFRSTEFGQEQDRVIVKSTGEPTYRLPDIAYHRTKYERGFDLIIDLFGADHIATYPDVLAGLQALGYDSSRTKVLIHQFVTLYEGTEKVRMSTRKANFVTLDELMDEVGVDVTRWFFLMRSMDSHLNFDLSLAKSQSEENPVYYNQYAHARICSILRNAAEARIEYRNSETLQHLHHPAEMQLIKKLLNFPNLVERCTRDFTPHLMTQYLSEVSTLFHKFYTECRVLTDDTDLSQARLALIRATKAVLANGFKILGVTAPERM